VAWEVVTAGLGSAFITGLVSLVVGWQQSRFAMNRLNAEHCHQITVNDRQKQQQVFSQLMGQKFMLPQLYVSRFEAIIYTEYHQARWNLAGTPEGSFDLQEAQRWIRRSEELALRISENNQVLFETIGMTRILFPAMPELDGLIDRIYHFKTPEIKGPPNGANTIEVESWQSSAVKQLQDLAENEYAKPIESLLDYLGSELRQ
jgi:hypothetical protein